MLQTSSADCNSPKTSIPQHAIRLLRHAQFLYSLSDGNGDYNFLDFIYFDENTYTSIIKFFLNYKEKNEFIFLKKFIELLRTYLLKSQKYDHIRHLLDLSFAEDKDLHPIYIRREFFVGSGRIDLLLVFPRINIVIENKLWADFTNSQIDKYYEYFSKTNSRFLIILLCPENEKIRYLNYLKQSSKISEKNYFIILEHDNFILEWINACYSISENLKIRIYLQDFKNKLIKVLNSKESQMNESISIIKNFLETEVHSDQNNLFAVLENILYASYILTIEKLNSFIIEICKKIFKAEEHYEIKGQLNLHEDYSKIYITNKEWSKITTVFPSISIEVLKEFAELKIGFPKPEDLSLLPDCLSRLPDWLLNSINILSQEKGILSKKDEYWLCYTTIHLNDFILHNNSNYPIPRTFKSFGNLLQILSCNYSLQSFLLSIEYILAEIKRVIDETKKEEVKLE